MKLFAQSWRNQPRESLAWSGIQPVRRLRRPAGFRAERCCSVKRAPASRILRGKSLTFKMLGKIHRTRVSADKQVESVGVRGVTKVTSLWHQWAILQAGQAAYDRIIPDGRVKWITYRSGTDCWPH